MKYRDEFDSIGKIKVSGDKYWGASTERSRKLYFSNIKSLDIVFKSLILNWCPFIILILACLAGLHYRS